MKPKTVNAIKKRFPILRSLMVMLCSLAFAALFAGPVQAWDIESEYDPDTRTLTVRVIEPIGNWDDLEVQCAEDAVKADFTLPPGSPWVVKEIITRNHQKYVRLERSLTDQPQTVELSHTGDEDLGAEGVISATLQNGIRHSESGLQTMVPISYYPTLSQWVLIILALSVGGLFVWQLARRRKAALSV